MRRLFLFIMLLVAGISVKGRNDSVYLFCYFKGDGKDGLHLAYSKDGYEWTALNRDSALLKPALGKESLMRDPCIVYGADKLFHMVWSVSWKGNEIGYANSKDLVHWSRQLPLAVMKDEKNAMNCWAPEIIYDGRRKKYMIYWATTIRGKFPETDQSGDYNHRIYYTLTKDFKKFTRPVLLLEPGFNVIDATILNTGKEYVMVLKDETKAPVAKKSLHTSRSGQLTGPYCKPSKAITGPYWAEGPALLKLDNGWILYFDKYKEGKFGALITDNFENWKDESEQLRMPKGIRHGTAFKVSVSQFNVLYNSLQ